MSYPKKQSIEEPLVFSPAAAERMRAASTRHRRGGQPEVVYQPSYYPYNPVYNPVAAASDVFFGTAERAAAVPANAAARAYGYNQAAYDPWYAPPPMYVSQAPTQPAIVEYGAPTAGASCLACQAERAGSRVAGGMSNDFPLTTHDDPRERKTRSRRLGGARRAYSYRNRAGKLVRVPARSL